VHPFDNPGTRFIVCIQIISSRLPEALPHETRALRPSRAEDA
jgi:hypothetical protein